MESKVSGHWTDDRLVEHLYDIEPEDPHLRECQECRARLSRMQNYRRAMESASEEDVSVEFLAAQRRKIYARLTEPRSWWSDAPFRRWASAAATLAILGGGIALYEEMRQHGADRISDAQLAQQVASMAQDNDPQAAAPLQALFDE